MMYPYPLTFSNEVTLVEETPLERIGNNIYCNLFRFNLIYLAVLRVNVGHYIS